MKLAQVTNYQLLECFLLRGCGIRDITGTRAMEALKIILLIALIGAIAIASRRKDRRPKPERPV